MENEKNALGNSRVDEALLKEVESKLYWAREFQCDYEVYSYEPVLVAMRACDAFSKLDQLRDENKEFTLERLANIGVFSDEAMQDYLKYANKLPLEKDVRNINFIDLEDYDKCLPFCFRRLTQEIIVVNAILYGCGYQPPGERYCNLSNFFSISKPQRFNDVHRHNLSGPHPKN